MEPYLQIAFKSISVYVFIILAIRIFGKKELSQLSVIDLVFILLISNSVQNAMVGPDTSLAGGMAAALALFVANSIFRFFLRSSKKFNKMIQGDPIIIVHACKIDPIGLKKSGLTENEIEMAIREHGVEGIAKCNLVVLEVDGNISVVSKEDHDNIVRKKKIQISHNP